MAEKYFKFPVRIYWEDTDAGGIVYHSNYLRYMERARTELLRQLGYEQHRLVEEGMPLIVVARAELVFRRPAKLDDLLCVETRMTQIGRASFVFRQVILRGEEVIAEGTIRCGTIDPEKKTPTAMPRTLYNAFLPYLAEEAC